MQLSRRWRIPLGEMLERMSNFELLYQLVLESLDPSGEERADLRSAWQTSALVNIQIPGKRDKTTPKDFLLTEALSKQRATRGQTIGVEKKFDRTAFFKNLKSVIGKK